MIKILIADDHPIVRQGLKQILADTPNMMVGGEATNGQEVLDKVRSEPWDLLILDMAMPGRDGLDILATLKHDQPELPVLVLSMYPEDQLAVRILQAGASGYLNKESAPQELVHAIEKVLQGGKYVSPMLAEKLVSHAQSRAGGAPHERLTNREYQIMLRLASGETVTAVAHELALSVKTVSTHRAHILEKMQLHTNAELAQYAIHNQLLH